MRTAISASLAAALLITGCGGGGGEPDPPASQPGLETSGAAAGAVERSTAPGTAQGRTAAGAGPSPGSNGPSAKAGRGEPASQGERPGGQLTVERIVALLGKGAREKKAGGKGEDSLSVEEIVKAFRASGGKVIQQGSPGGSTESQGRTPADLLRELTESARGQP